MRTTTRFKVYRFNFSVTFPFKKLKLFLGIGIAYPFNHKIILTPIHIICQTTFFELQGCAIFRGAYLRFPFNARRKVDLTICVHFSVETLFFSFQYCTL